MNFLKSLWHDALAIAGLRNQRGSVPVTRPVQSLHDSARVFSFGENLFFPKASATNTDPHIISAAIERVMCKSGWRFTHVTPEEMGVTDLNGRLCTPSVDEDGRPQKRKLVIVWHNDMRRVCPDNIYLNNLGWQNPLKETFLKQFSQATAFVQNYGCPMEDQPLPGPVVRHGAAGSSSHHSFGTAA